MDTGEVEVDKEILGKGDQIGYDVVATYQRPYIGRCGGILGQKGKRVGVRPCQQIGNCCPQSQCYACSFVLIYVVWGRSLVVLSVVVLFCYYMLMCYSLLSFVPYCIFFWILFSLKPRLNQKQPLYLTSEVVVTTVYTLPSQKSCVDRNTLGILLFLHLFQSYHLSSL